MTQAIPQFLTFDEFIAWYPENSTTHYELHYGKVVKLPRLTGNHSKLAGFTAGTLGIEIRRLSLPYLIPKECVIKSVRNESGYEPDVIVLDKQTIAEEQRWQKESIITKGKSVRLIIEVVSTNWRDDYALKLEEYEALGIPEYWIIDYLGLGGRRFIGNPKQPTISIYQLIEGEYAVKQFRENSRIESLTFSELNLTASQIFQAAR